MSEEKRPVLVCRDKNGKINHVDLDLCKRQFIYFGKWLPLFPCGDRHNIHTCELLTNSEIREYERMAHTHV